MSKKICFLFLITAAFFTACNNSSKDSDNSSDTTNKTMSDETMNHNTASDIPVPDLPPVPDGANIFFKNLKNGATISSPFKVEMGTKNIKVDTAGPVIAGLGHHHLFINATDSLAAGTIIPADSSHIHFGKGQMEYELKLMPGKYKLTLQFADGLHRSYGGKLSATVNVTVK